MATKTPSPSKPKLPILLTSKAIVTILLTPEQADDSSNTNGTLASSGTNISPEKVMLHKDFLCHYSPFFAAAFNGNFQEGATQTMELEANFEAFGIIANWFYTQGVDDPNGQYLGVPQLARVWVLVERFLIPKLQNQIMDTLHDWFHLNPEIRFPNFGGFAKIACEHSKGENKLFELGCWIMSWCGERFVDASRDEIPQAMLSKALQLAKNSRKWDVSGMPASKFYVIENIKPWLANNGGSA